MSRKTRPIEDKMPEHEKINRIVQILTDSMRCSARGRSFKEVDFRALKLKSRTRDNVYYYDAGHVNDIYQFANLLTERLGHNVASSQSEEFLEWSSFGGHSRRYSFTDESRDEQRHLVEVHYKCPDNRYLDAWFRGHEEAHAVHLCSDPLADFAAEVRRTFKIDLGGNLGRYNPETLAGIGGFLAVAKQGMSVKKFAREYISRFIVSNPESVAEAYDILVRDFHRSP